MDTMLQHLHGGTGAQTTRQNSGHARIPDFDRGSEDGIRRGWLVGL